MQKPDISPIICTGIKHKMELVMKSDINQIINDLVKVGEKYLEDYPERAFRFFHHNQQAAKLLVSLKENTSHLLDDDKINLVRTTVYRLYHDHFMNSLSSLLHSVHDILMENFAEYKEKYTLFDRKSEGLVPSLDDFRKTVSAIAPKQEQQIELTQIKKSTKNLK